MYPHSLTIGLYLTTPPLSPTVSLSPLLSLLQEECERELAQAHAYESRVLSELEEVASVEVRGAELTQEDVDQVGTIIMGAIK